MATDPHGHTQIGPEVQVSSERCFWTEALEQLVISIITALITRFVVPPSLARRKWIAWSDAAGLAAFAVQGSFIALDQGVSHIVAVVMGMLTATGGGVVRGLLCGERPMILNGQLYASAALAGSAVLVVLVGPGVSSNIAGTIGFLISPSLVRSVTMSPPLRFSQSPYRQLLQIPHSPFQLLSSVPCLQL